MRNLTQQEIDDTPDWATHYKSKGNCVLFESENITQLMVSGELGNLIPFGPVSPEAKPIPRKPFDISDLSIELYARNSSGTQKLHLDVDGGNPYFTLTGDYKGREIQIDFDVLSMANLINLRDMLNKAIPTTSN